MAIHVVQMTEMTHFYKTFHAYRTGARANYNVHAIRVKSYNYTVKSVIPSIVSNKEMPSLVHSDTFYDSFRCLL